MKYGYQMERVYPDREEILAVYGPTVTRLRAYSWKIRYPPKIKHFLWQIVSGCIPVKKKSTSKRATRQ